MPLKAQPHLLLVSLLGDGCTQPRPLCLSDPLSLSKEELFKASYWTISCVHRGTSNAPTIVQLLLVLAMKMLFVHSRQQGGSDCWDHTAPARERRAPMGTTECWGCAARLGIPGMLMGGRIISSRQKLWTWPNAFSDISMYMVTPAMSCHQANPQRRVIPCH